MAYSFNGTNQSLSVTSTPVTTAPHTMFVVANVAAVGTTMRLFNISQVGFAVGFYLGATGSTFPIDARYALRQTIPTVLAGGVSNVGVVFQDTWIALTGLEESSTSRYVFSDTTKSTQNTTNITPATTGMGIGIGATYATFPANFFNGLGAEAAIWDVALTDDEITSLARGFKPFRVRPQNLKFYAPIVRDLNDLCGALTITNNNTATVANHPRVY